MDGLRGDLRIGFRALWRQPGFTVVAALSLALGIGLNTTIFSVVHTVLLKKLAIEEPERLVDIYTSPRDEFPYLTTSYPDFLDLKAEVEAFEDMAAHAVVRGILTADGKSELVMGEVATASYFPLLGVRPMLGRTFSPEEDGLDARSVVVLGHGLWRRRFGGDEKVIGQTLRLSGIEYTIVGVAPPAFVGTIPGLRPEFWVPTGMVERLSFSGIQSETSSPGSGARLERRGTRWLFVEARLAAGATLEAARAQVETVLSRLAAAHPETNEKVKATVLPRTDVRLHPMVDDVLANAGAVLFLGVGLVLVIACANVANLLLARATHRRGEIAVRVSMGASRVRLIRQLMTESVLLAGLGGALGAGLAYWAARLLTAFQPALSLPLTFSFALDGTVLGYTALVSLAAAIVFGLVPAFHASRPDLVPALKGELGDGPSGARRFSLSQALVVGQLAVSVVLLVAGALLTRGLLEAQKIDVGFDPSRIAALGFNLQMNNYTLEEAEVLQREALAELEALPGVEKAALSSRLPFAPDINMTAVFIPGLHESEDDAVPVDVVQVSEDYFRVVGVPIVEGRPFDARDREGSPRVAIVNETMARRFWPDRSPVGERILDGGPDGTSIEIVGVSRDHKVRSLDEEPRPYLHLAKAQSPSRATLVLARTRGPAAPVLPLLRRTILELEPEIAFTDEGTAAEVADITLAPTRLGAGFLGAFAGLALFLAAIGLYGVISYVATRRTWEVGLRMALGADRSSVLKMFLRQGMTLAVLGIVLGGAAAAVVSRVLGSLLYGVSTLDPVAYGIAAAVLLLVALAANGVPAWRASRVSPTAALRYE